MEKNGQGEGNENLEASGGFREVGAFFATGARVIVRENARTALFLIITLFAPLFSKSWVFAMVAVIASILYFGVSIINFMKVQEHDELAVIIKRINKGKTKLWALGALAGAAIIFIAWTSSITFSSGIEGFDDSEHLEIQLVMLVVLIIISVMANFVPEIWIANWKRDEKNKKNNGPSKKESASVGAFRPLSTVFIFFLGVAKVLLMGLLVAPLEGDSRKKKNLSKPGEP